MNYIIIAALIGILIVPILIAYYYDYKSNPKQFSSSLKVDLVDLKKLLRWVILSLLALGINFLYKAVIPFNKEHGIVFNQERENLGLPTLDETWYLDKDRSEQFTTYWWKNDVQKGLFKKEITYSIFDIKAETNYYKNPNYQNKIGNSSIYAWSIYDFSTTSTTYFMDNPEYGFPFEPKQEKTIEIPQKVFNEYLSE